MMLALARTSMRTLDGLRQRLDTDGFAVIDGFVAPEAIGGLRTRALEIVGAFDPSVASGFFTTRDQSEKCDEYFLGSAATIRCFFEEEAFDERGALKQPKALSINKIGHALHDLDPVFERFSRTRALDELVRAAGIAV